MKRNGTDGLTLWHEVINRLSVFCNYTLWVYSQSFQPFLAIILWFNQIEIILRIQKNYNEAVKKNSTHNERHTLIHMYVLLWPS